MNDIIAVPTVEQINLEHQLANSKASEAVQHATNCGLMLLQVKASLAHGEWLPWLNGEIEAGRLKVKTSQAHKYMRLASNLHCGVNLLESPSINAALELLTDKEPDDAQGTLIDIDAERQAREAAEVKAEAERQAREFAEQQLSVEIQRAGEWREESNARRKTISEMESQINFLKAQPAPQPVIKVIEKIPADYEAIKAKAAQLETELATNKAEQTRIIQSAIKAKLSGYQGEVDALEAKKRNLEKQAKEYQDYLASLTGTAKQMESQARAFEKSRQALIDLASELGDFSPINPQLNRKALALAEMHDAAAQSIRMVFKNASPELTIVQGDAA